MLARHAGLTVTAHHVDHRIRPESAAEAERARQIAATIGVRFVEHRVDVEPGPNLEARARSSRRAVLPADAMTGHTMDDQAETLLIRLLRGSGTTGLASMRAGERHPILALRRTDTEAVCAALGIAPNRDPSNDDRSLWRSRTRHELLPLAADIAERDVVPILARTAELLAADDEVLERLGDGLDPTDARAVAKADPVVARRALRAWLAADGYPPDTAAIDRVLAVARGEVTACEIPGGRRVERSNQRFRIVAPDE